MFDFPLELSELASVPQPFQILYEEKDGAFSLIKELANKGMDGSEKEQLKILGDTNTVLKKELDAYRALGKSPEKLRNTLSGFENSLAQKKEEMTTLLQKNDHYLIETTASKAISEAKGNVPLLLPHIRSLTGVLEEAGNRVLQVFNEEGDIRTTENGQAFSVADLVKEMKATPMFASAFDGDDISGGGMKPGSGAPSRSTIDRHDHLALSASLEEIAAGKISVS